MHRITSLSPCRRLAILTLIAMPLLWTGCSGRAPGPRLDTDRTLTGTASWYGGKYHGRTTANGETFDKNAMTAAHKTLPFGTRVRVTNLGNGRSVVVRINDRGPFIRGRIIDLSRKAAERLGFRKAGLAKVRVEIIS
ncbi:MAG: septal ring lytic transglycosylase RlpA family protein [bacterium]|nr:septal ring lytic transglycosylase RlpA family protein [bacterium]